jgi:putative glutamine amidotransferase
MPKVAVPEPHAGKPDYNQRSLPSYLDCLRRVGLEPVVLSAHSTLTEIARIAAECQGVLLPGSPADVAPSKYGASTDPHTAPADPLRDNLDEMLIQDAHNLHKPLFAICYGVQILNVWRTGTLIQHLPTEPVNHEAGSKVVQAHQISIEQGSHLLKLNGSKAAWVNSSHHQALEHVGDGLRVTARSVPDGVIEAVEGISPDHWVIGVQWHPERTYDEEPLSRALFSDFATAVKSWEPRAVTESVVARG